MLWKIIFLIFIFALNILIIVSESSAKDFKFRPISANENLEIQKACMNPDFRGEEAGKKVIYLLKSNTTE